MSGTYMITEQGNLGLGLDLLNEHDQELYNQSNEKDRAVVEKVIIKDENGGVTKSTQVINENKK